MKITIITVSYNAENTIEATINSVINQTYNDIEYIIIDGKSTDNTLDIIKRYKNKITKWISEKDDGIYDAMNKGITLASGDYIFFLNADDFLINNNIIEKVVSYLKKDSQIDLLSGKVFIVSEKLLIQRVFDNCNLEMIKKGGVIPHQGLFVKRKICDEYKFNNSYKIVSDFEFILKCALNNKKFYFIDDIIAYYGDGGTSAIFEEVRFKEHCDVLYRYLGENAKLDYIKKQNNVKNKIKLILKKNRYTELLSKYFIGWKKHKCNNKYCRWCKILDKK